MPREFGPYYFEEVPQTSETRAAQLYEEKMNALGDRMEYLIRNPQEAGALDLKGMKAYLDFLHNQIGSNEAQGADANQFRINNLTETRTKLEILYGQTAEKFRNSHDVSKMRPGVLARLFGRKSPGAE